MKTHKAEKVRYVFGSRASITPIAMPETLTTETIEPAAPQSSQLSLLQAPANLPVETTSDELLQNLLACKVSPDVARSLIESTPLDAIHLQLDCLPDRAPKDAAATLVKAVRENWEPPAEYFARLEAAEATQKARKF